MLTLQFNYRGQFFDWQLDEKHRSQIPPAWRVGSRMPTLCTAGVMMFWAGLRGRKRTPDTLWFEFSFENGGDKWCAKAWMNSLTGDLSIQGWTRARGRGIWSNASKLAGVPPAISELIWRELKLIRSVEPRPFYITCWYEV